MYVCTYIYSVIRYIENFRLINWQKKVVCNAWWSCDMDTFTASLSLCRGSHRSLLDSPHKGPLMRNCWSPNMLFNQNRVACDMSCFKAYVTSLYWRFIRHVCMASSSHLNKGYTIDKNGNNVTWAREKKKTLIFVIPVYDEYSIDVKELALNMFIDHCSYMTCQVNEWKKNVWVWFYFYCIVFITIIVGRHNRHDSVSNHQPYDCLLNRLFRHRSKKTSKPRVTGFCAGNSPGTGEFPAQWPVTRKMFPFDDVVMVIYMISHLHTLKKDILRWTMS